MQDLKKKLLIAVGTVAVVLGLLGIFVPMLPTTPFLLLAAVCYGHSSPRFYRWLLENRWLGDYIRNYREGRGIPLVQKVLSISLLWLTMGYTVWFVASAWWLRVLLLSIASGVTFHLIRIKTLKTDKSSQQPLFTPSRTSEEAE
jgi:uncharacterized membrane protein YbaN (DUF454 family)